MNDRVLVQLATDDLLYEGIGKSYADMAALSHAKHAAYCAKYNADFITVDQGESTTWRGPERRNINWRKVEIMVEMIEKYNKVLYLDADSVIVRDDFDLFTASGYGIAFCAVWEQDVKVRPHIQAGVCYLTASPEVKEFLHEWNKWDGKDKSWHDQSIMNELMMQRKWHDILTILPNRFNHCDDTQEARDPFIRSFHGKGGRWASIERLCQ